MAEQDVGIHITANTSSAQQSIQDLEENLNGLQDLQSKGIGQGFLNDDDIQQFQNLSDRATQVYQNFYRNYEQIVSDLNDKRNQLRQQITQSTDQTDIESLRRRIDQIDVQRLGYNSERTIADTLNTRRGTVYQSSQPYINGTFTSENPSNPRFGGQQPLPSESQGGNGSSNGGNGGINNSGSGNGGNSTSVIPSFSSRIPSFLGTLFGFHNITSGMQQIRDQESEMAQVGTRVGGFGSNFAQGRITAGNIGYQNGYTSAQTISLANQYSSIAGASSPSKMWSAVQNLQLQSRQLGVNPNQLAQTEGQIHQFGALGSTGDQQQFADMIAGAVRQDNMQGRQGEMVQATGSLVAQAANGQTSFSQGQVQNIIALQSEIGQNNPGLRGANGARMLSTMNSSIQQGGPQMELALGYGTKYQGAHGLLQIQRMEAQGISNPHNLSQIFRTVQQTTSGTDNQELALEQILHLSAPQVDAIYRNRKVRNEIEHGNLNEKEIQRLVHNGSQTNNQNDQNYNNSNAGQRARNDAGWSQAQQSSAGPLDWLTRGLGSLINPWTAGIAGLGIIGSSVMGSRGLAGMFGRGASHGMSGGGGSFAERAATRAGNWTRDTYDTMRDMWRGSDMRSSVMGDMSSARRWFSGTRAGQWASSTWRDLSGRSIGGHTIGDIVSRAGGMTRGFRSSMGDLARNAGTYFRPSNMMDQLSRDFSAARNWGARTLDHFGGIHGLAHDASQGGRGFGNFTRWGGRLLGGASRVLGPIADFQMFKDSGPMAGGIWDWAFGHRNGQHKTYTGINPFHDIYQGTYHNNREGAFQQAWNWLSGNGNKSRSSQNRSNNNNNSRNNRSKSSSYLNDSMLRHTSSNHSTSSQGQHLSQQQRDVENYLHKNPGADVPLNSLNRSSSHPWWDILGLTSHHASNQSISSTYLNDPMLRHTQSDHLTSSQRQRLSRDNQYNENILKNDPGGTVPLRGSRRSSSHPWWDIFDLTDHHSNSQNDMRASLHGSSRSGGGSTLGFIGAMPSSVSNTRQSGRSKVDLNERERQLEQTRRNNLQTRERLDNQEEQSLQKQGKNIQGKDQAGSNDMSRTLGGSGSSSSGGMSWLGQMFHGIGNFFSQLFHFGSNGGSSSGGSATDQMKNGVSNGAAQWSSRIQQAASAEGVSLSPTELHTIQQRITKESNGSQTVTNNWDSNAKAGHPSTGLLQYIQGTFNKYAAKGHTNIHSGYDQLLALFNDKNWLKDISVSGGWGPSGGTRGYANGTDYSASGNVTVSEGNSPEIVTSPSGQSVLSTRQTSFYNFMSGSQVTPLNRLGSMNGVNWNQSSMMMQAISQLARVSAGGAATSGNKTVNVKVSGSIDGLTKENNDKVASSIAGYFSGQPLAFDTSRS